MPVPWHSTCATCAKRWHCPSGHSSPGCHRRGGPAGHSQTARSLRRCIRRRRSIERVLGCRASSGRRVCRSNATQSMQTNVMSAARNLTKRVGSKLLLLTVASAILSGSASAQMGGGKPGAGPPDTGPTPLEQQRQKQLDNDYKAATKNIPSQKPKDPWGDIRPTPTGKSQ